MQIRSTCFHRDYFTGCIISFSPFPLACSGSWPPFTRCARRPAWGVLFLRDEDDRLVSLSLSLSLSLVLCFSVRPKRAAQGNPRGLSFRVAPSFLPARSSQKAKEQGQWKGVSSLPSTARPAFTARGPTTPLSVCVYVCMESKAGVRTNSLRIQNICAHNILCCTTVFCTSILPLCST